MITNATRRRRNRTPRIAALLLTLVGAAGLGCGDSDDEPRVQILNPTAGSALSLGTTMKVNVTISANDFELKSQCGTDMKCGSAYLNIDGDACNQPGKPYNAILGDGRLGQDFFIEADFSLCPPASRIGAHNLSVSLRDPAGMTVPGTAGAPAQATISIVTTP
jgi:hypothetical protein